MSARAAATRLEVSKSRAARGFDARADTAAGGAMDSVGAMNRLFDVARRTSSSLGWKGASSLSYALDLHAHRGIPRRALFRPHSHRGAGAACEHRDAARVYDRLCQRPGAAKNAPRFAETLQGPAGPAHSDTRNNRIGGADAELAPGYMAPFDYLAHNRSGHLLHLRKEAQSRPMKYGESILSLARFSRLDPR